MLKCVTDLISLTEGSAVVFCEYGNEPSGFIQGTELSDHPSCCQLLKMASAQRSYVIIWLEWKSQRNHTEYWL